MCADAVTALMSGASIRTRSLHRHCLRAMLRSVRGRRCRKVSTVVCRVCHSLGLLRAGYTHTGVQRLKGRTRSSRCNGGSDGWAERAADRSAVVAGSTWSRSLCSQPKGRKGALQRAALAPIMQAHAHASKRARTRARAPAHLYPALMQMLERTPHHRLHRASQLIRCGIAGGRLAHSFALGC